MQLSQEQMGCHTPCCPLLFSLFFSGRSCRCSLSSYGTISRGSDEEEFALYWGRHVHLDDKKRYTRQVKKTPIVETTIRSRIFVSRFWSLQEIVQRAVAEFRFSMQQSLQKTQTRREVISCTVENSANDLQTTAI